MRGTLALVAVAAGLLVVPALAAADCTIPGGTTQDPNDATMVSPQDFQGTFPSSMLGDFVQIPFTVPAGTTAIRIRYCYDQPPASTADTLDMGVYSPLQGGDTFWGPAEIRGWSGSAVKDLAIAENGFTDESTYLTGAAGKKGYVHGATTRAYRPGSIPAGTWAVELGLASILPAPDDPDGGVAWRVRVETSSSTDWSTAQAHSGPYSPVAYDTTPVSTQPGWYAGDLHAHGEQEPGNASMHQTFDYGFKSLAQGGAGLDFMTLVDHNNDIAYQGEDGRLQPNYPGKLIIPGTEVTTYRGHWMNQGLHTRADFRAGPVFAWDPTANGDLGALGAQVRGPLAPSTQFAAVQTAGGWTQINHPTIFPSTNGASNPACRGCPWDYTAPETDYSKVDAIEVQTGPALIGTFRQSVHGRPRSPSTRPLSTPATTSPPSAAATPTRPISSRRHLGADRQPDDRSSTPRALSEDAIIAGGQGRTTPTSSSTATTGPTSASPATPSAQPDSIFGDSRSGGGIKLDAEVLNAGSHAARPASDYRLILLRDGDKAADVAISGNDFKHTFTETKSGRYSLEVARGDTEQFIEDYSSPIWFTRIKPSNTVRLGAPKLNRGNGSALLPVTVPGPGSLKLSGNGLKQAKASPRAKGTVKLAVKPTGCGREGAEQDGQGDGQRQGHLHPQYGTARTAKKSITLKQN